MHLIKDIKINRIRLMTIVMFAALLAACNSMDKDAQKAAQLTNQSIEEMTKLNLTEAQTSYRKAQNIIRKYNEKGKADEFMPLYRKYRDQGKYMHENPELKQ
jgi:outer membrane protein assembly factor BamD (BamD/ComL family)